MPKNFSKIINELRTLKFGRKVLNYSEFRGIIIRAGYRIETNGNQHAEIHRSDGTNLINDDGLPVIFTANCNNYMPGHYKKIISAIIDDLESV